MPDPNDATPQAIETASLPATISSPAAPINPFERTNDRSREDINQGAIAIEQERAIAEAQGKLVIAQKFPRNPYKSFEAMMTSCARKGFAKTAFYNYPRGSERVTGPTIRLAEELARCWGNVDYGLRELSNREGVSEMEAYAWDMQTNTITKQQFTVRHIRDRQQGARELTDQRDIYEITANMGARRMRARILAILPDDYVDAAIVACRATLEREESKIPMPQRIRTLVESFNGVNVSVAMLEGFLGHSLEACTSDELLDLRGVYLAVHNGTHKASDYFGAARIAEPTTTGTDTAGAEARSREMPSGGAGAVGGPTSPPAKRRGGAPKSPPAATTTAAPAAAAPPAAQTAPPAGQEARQDAPAPKIAEPAAQAPAPAQAPPAPAKPEPKPEPAKPAGPRRELF